MAMSSSEAILPDEIIYEILTRLPVKSLCRFRCVSRQWLTISYDPKFIDAHLASSSSRPRLLITFDVDHGNFDIRSNGMFFSVDYRQTHGGTGTCQNLDLIRLPIGLPLYEWEFLDGMLYSNQFNDTIKVINPAIAECATFEYTAENYKLLFCRQIYYGFDHVKGAIRIFNGGRSIDVFEYYSLVMLDTHFFLPVFCTCIDGIMYTARHRHGRDGDGTTKGLNLITIDTRTGKFRAVPFPNGSFIRRVVELGGRFALADDRDLLKGKSNELILWVLDDLENKIWRSKKCIFPWIQSGLCFKFFEVTPKNEVVVAPTTLTNPFYLLIYNLETDTARRVEFPGLYERLEGWPLEKLRPKVYTYTESLRSPGDLTSQNMMDLFLAKLDQQTVEKIIYC